MAAPNPTGPPPPSSSDDHPRLHLPGLLSPDTCKELAFVHRSCSAVGYRPSVLSTTLPHLAATGCGHLLLPFVPLRERLREVVEAAFGCEFELCVEFTGLISWCKGASIGWHSDDNKPYLRQRAFTAVCYLNNHGKDYKGGILHFQDGEPSYIVPVAGDAVIYTADHRNIHSVDEVTEGERLTLTLWFTRESAYDEDPKLISFLSRTPSHELAQEISYLPLPASDNMYWFSHEQSGFDIRCARVRMLGFSFHSTSNGACGASISSGEDDPSELLTKPLRLGRGDDVFEATFVNSLHALQVVQFYYWKASELAAMRKQNIGVLNSVQSPVFHKSRGTDLPLSCDHELEKTVFGPCGGNIEFLFDWNDFALALAMWESYGAELKEKLSSCLPYWLSNRTIFHVNCAEPQ